MPRPNRSKKKPPIEISDEEFTSTFSLPSPSLSLFRIGEKRGYFQSSPEKENQKPVKKIIKLITTTANTPSIPSYSPSPEQYLRVALDSLIKAYEMLEDEEQQNKLKRQWSIYKVLYQERIYLQKKKKKKR